MPAGDVFGLDGFFLNKSNPVIVSTIGINSTGSGAGIAVTGGSFNDGSFTLNLSNAAGLSTTPFYTGAKIAVSNVGNGYNGTFVVTGFAGTTTVSYATSSYVGTVTTPLSSLTGTLALLVTDTQVTNTTWSTSQTHGWFGGGAFPTVSSVDRIDFSNDTGTTNIRGPLSSVRVFLAATGNSNYGWFGGGGPGQLSTVDRIDFSNDSGSTSIRGSLSLARYGLAATGNSNYGWFGGGYAPTTNRTTVDRIDFSNDSSTASPRGPLSLARVNSAATGNSNYGWFGGGSVPAPGASLAGVVTVDRIDFSNDSSTASVRGSLSLARAYLAATGNSNYGWFGGGRAYPSPNQLATVDRIDFSNDSVTASPRGSLSLARYGLSATGNSNYGWFGGGYNPGGQRSTVDRIDFSNDLASASPRGSLSLARYLSAATSGQAKSSSIRLQKAGNFGWFGGGQIPSPGVAVSTVDRINFSNDLSSASPRSTLNSFIRSYTGATGNSNYGWWAGGKAYPATSPATNYSIVDRIDFSNDINATVTRGSLSDTRFGLAGTGNSNYGWFGKGSKDPITLTTVDRINFSNDLTTASVRGGLNQFLYFVAATGNSNYGWWAGGATGGYTNGSISRLNFANDSFVDSNRGYLLNSINKHSATGNSNYGWFGGGYSGGFTQLVQRIDFASDNASLTRGNLSGFRSGTAAAGNSNYGWFGGGYFPSLTSLSTVDRINFANDSISASPRGVLSQAREGLSATSNTPT